MTINDKPQKWLTSDWHMYHKNIIRLCQRPFADLEEMRETIISNFNSRVGVNDTAYLLGDILWADSYINEVIPRLNCKNLILICGNHDGSHLMHKKSAKIKDCMLKGGFSEVHEDITIRLGEYLARLCHFPYLDPNTSEEFELRYREWRPKKGPEDLMIHGHSHSKPDKILRTKPYLSLDCGVDGNNFMPWSGDEILAELKQI